MATPSISLASVTETARLHKNGFIGLPKAILGIGGALHHCSGMKWLETLLGRMSRCGDPVMTSSPTKEEHRLWSP